MARFFTHALATPLTASTSWLALAAVLALTLLANLGGCEDTGKAGANVAPVKIAGKTYFLEIASDNPTRTRGLGGRTSIEDDGGMIFVFPSRESVLEFVMRDCPIDIDIIFTDASGRVVATHAMTKEEPRGEGEGKAGEQNDTYELRLKRYSSKFPSTFAIELKAGTLAKINVKEGDKVEFDALGLKQKAR